MPRERPQVARAGRQMRFPCARQAKAEDILGAADKVARLQIGQLPPDAQRQAAFVKNGKRFPWRQLRLQSQTLNAPLLPRRDLLLQQVG
jgi:hypothetical protein